MSSHPVLDAHIHLWPSTATSATDHTWMTPKHPLAKRHGISDYAAAAVPAPTGFIYVETDRALPGSSPHVTSIASDDEARSALESWAAAPLDEIRFLRRVAEESPHEGDGFEAGDGKRMKGVVLWAPFHVPAALFQTYLRLAEDVAGPALWARVVGFRFLLQGKREGEVGALVQSVAWVENVVALGKGRGGKGWAFDVGVDTHRDGVEGLELVAGMVDEVRRQEKKKAATGSYEPVRFVINHLAKPPLSSPSPSTPHPTWLASLSRLGTDAHTSIKLSGLLNEFTTPTPAAVPDALAAIQPYAAHVLDAFPRRVMFGSDWPVCNVGGPRDEAGNWSFWREVVEACLEASLGEEDRESVWWGAAAEAYRVDVDVGEN